MTDTHLLNMVLKQMQSEFRLEEDRWVNYFGLKLMSNKLMSSIEIYDIVNPIRFYLDFAKLTTIRENEIDVNFIKEEIVRFLKQELTDGYISLR